MGNQRSQSAGQSMAARYHPCIPEHDCRSVLDLHGPDTSAGADRFYGIICSDPAGCRAPAISGDASVWIFYMDEAGTAERSRDPNQGARPASSLETRVVMC